MAIAVARNIRRKKCDNACDLSVLSTFLALAHFLRRWRCDGDGHTGEKLGGLSLSPIH
jgi:hypothetical protein